MKTKTYYHGDGTSKWGIYNSVAKCFQFGICEDSPYKAEKKLFKKIGYDSYKWRFETRVLPKAEKEKINNYGTKCRN